jgi:hypothetical protein
MEPPQNASTGFLGLLGPSQARRSFEASPTYASSVGLKCPKVAHATLRPKGLPAIPGA